MGTREKEYYHMQQGGGPSLENIPAAIDKILLLVTIEKMR
jgi:hypothetical protein